MASGGLTSRQAREAEEISESKINVLKKSQKVGYLVSIDKLFSQKKSKKKTLKMVF